MPRSGRRIVRPAHPTSRAAPQTSALCTPEPLAASAGLIGGRVHSADCNRQTSPGRTTSQEQLPPRRESRSTLARELRTWYPDAWCRILFVQHGRLKKTHVNRIRRLSPQFSKTQLSTVSRPYGSDRQVPIRRSTILAMVSNLPITSYNS